MIEQTFKAENGISNEKSWPACSPVMMKTTALTRYAKNSRTHPPEQIEHLAALIQRFGFTNPILIDEKNIIIAGHGRLMAAKRLGLEEVPCIVARGWSDDERAAYVIADNQSALNAGWDFGILTEEVAALKENNFDLSLLGFDDDTLAQMFAEPEPEYSGDPDEAPAVAERAVAVPGDIWQLGRHRLMCGEIALADCDVIIKRWQNFTGQKATLVDDGRTFDEIENVRCAD